MLMHRYASEGCLHLMALASEAEVDMDITEFNRIADKTPYIGNLTPSGK